MCCRGQHIGPTCLQKPCSKNGRGWLQVSAYKLGKGICLPNKKTILLTSVTELQPLNPNLQCHGNSLLFSQLRLYGLDIRKIRAERAFLRVIDAQWKRTNFQLTLLSLHRVGLCSTLHYLALLIACLEMPIQCSAAPYLT